MFKFMSQLGFVSATFFSATALAQDSVPTEKPVTVSASRFAQTVDSSLAAVTVITRADIEQSQAPDFFELLRTVPGVDVTRSGGIGQNTSIFLRGTNSNHVLVLINGIRVASVNTGAYTFEHLSLDQIERIEIVRGPRAAYWGSDAIGGVIQIFTRQLHAPVTRLAAGRWDRYESSTGYGVETERGGFSIHASGTQFGGFSAQNQNGFSYDPDRDGYIQRNLNLHGKYLVGDYTLEAHALGKTMGVDFDQGHSNSRDHAIGFSVSGPIQTFWSHSISLGHAKEFFNTPVFFNAFDTRSATLDWVNDLAINDQHRLVFGLNAKQEKGANLDTSSNAALYRQNRTNWGAFASWHGQYDDLNWEAALRADQNSVFGHTTSAQTALGWRFNDHLKTYASYGEGFRAPNLNELYSPGFGGLFAGNPDLEPERSRSAELGLSWDNQQQQWNFRLFQNHIDELIAFQGNETFRALNINRARIRGAELSWSTKIDSWQFKSDLTWQNPKDVLTGQTLLRRPQRKIGFDVAHAMSNDRWHVGLGIVAASSRQDFASHLGGYGVISLRTEYQWAPHWRLGARLDNASNQDYELAGGFNTAKRSLLISLDYRADATDF
jgi:vitamin B12 transporter